MQGEILLREYIIAYDNSWIHFFIKPHVGLCSRRKDNLKFDEYKVLVSGAGADFCVYSSSSYIHVVCQDEKGSVLYLLYDGVSWKKRTLLESRTARPYMKNFVIMEISGHINILYTIENKEKLMLVHQLLIGNSTPSVIDYIKKDSIPFCASTHNETDFSVFYTNEDGICCEVIYKWSQKKFLPPKKLTGNISIRFAQNTGNTTHLAAIKHENNVRHLLYITKTTDYSEPEMIVYSNCQNDVKPVISNYGEKQYMVWTERGNVMSSCLGADNKWSKPIQYAKSSKTEIKLYVLCHEGKYEYYYGIAREHDFTLYGTHDVLKKPPKTTSGKHSTKNIYNTETTENLIVSQGKQIQILCDELSKQRKKLAELSSRIEQLLSSIPIADEEDIDNVLLN